MERSQLRLYEGERMLETRRALKIVAKAPEKGIVKAGVCPRPCEPTRTPSRLFAEGLDGRCFLVLYIKDGVELGDL